MALSPDAKYHAYYTLGIGVRGLHSGTQEEIQENVQTYVHIYAHMIKHMYIYVRLFCFIINITAAGAVDREFFYI